MMNKEEKVVERAKDELSSDVSLSTSLYVKESVIQIVELLAHLGQPTNDLEMILNLSRRLIRGYPLTPLEDKEEDWELGSEEIYHHKRCPFIVKKRNGKAVDLETGCHINFPYTP